MSDSAVLSKLEELQKDLQSIKTDVAVIAAKDYDERIKGLTTKTDNHSNRLVAVEVRSGFTALLISIVGGVIAYFSPHGGA